jgi:glutaredoxin
MDKYFSAYEVYKEGKSLNQVAVIFKVTRQCVYKAFVARKLKMRSTKPQEVQYFDGKKFTEWMGWNNVAHCEWKPFNQRILKMGGFSLAAHYWQTYATCEIKEFNKRILNYYWL